MAKTGLEFWNWGPARRVGSPSVARTILVIVIFLMFESCDLAFPFLQYFRTPQSLGMFPGKAFEI
jgi:hypothetical protein